jgi:glycosyltransferase involved in cell wall biosynthesis
MNSLAPKVVSEKWAAFTTASPAAPRRRVRVAYVIPALARGGAERQLLYLARGLDRSVFDPTVVLFEAACEGGYECDGLRESLQVLHIPASGNFRARNAPALLFGVVRLARLFRRLRPGVVHAFLPAAAVLGALASRLTGVPVFVTGRRSMAGFHRRGSSLLTWFDRMPLRFSAALIGNCVAIANEAVELDGVSAERAVTIYNCVDTAVFHPQPEPGLREQLGFRQRHVVFGVLANFHPNKRHIDLIAAADRILRIHPSARFLMVGADSGALPLLRSEIEARGIADYFRIVPGTAEPERFYRVMDVYISTSEVEGMSNSILEAMASGLPVIATNVGGNPELVEDQLTGYLVPPCRPDTIAECALRLATGSELRRRLGARALQVVAQRFSPASLVHAHQDLYLRLLADAAARL